MKAAVYDVPGPPSVFRYDDVPDPEVRPGAVLVDVEAISIEGGDTLHRLKGVVTRAPHIVGYQCAGTIAEVGVGVEDRHVGQRVVATVPHGSHAARVVAPIASTWLVPEGADIVEIACVPVAWGTADDCLFEFGRLVAGETVLVQAGAGGVGLAAIQLAKRAGATVVATAGDDSKLARLQTFGLDHGINYRTTDFADAALEFTGGRGVDLVVESVGSTIAGSLRSLAYRGRIAYVGDAGRDQQPVDLSGIKAGNQSIHGVFLGRELAAGPRAHANIDRLIGEVANGDLQVVIDRTFPLSDAAAAHEYIEGRGAFGRVVLIP